VGHFFLILPVFLWGIFSNFACFFVGHFCTPGSGSAI
jgi:hypothetical protein